MASNPIVIAIDGDPSGVIKAADDTSAALGKLTQSLEDTSTGGAKSTDQLTKDFTQYTDQIKEQTSQQTEVVSTGIEDQGRLVKEGVKGTAAALASTVAQSASGLNGTLEGVTSSATNIFSQLSYGLGGLGPEFALAAGGAALGFGLIDGLLKNSTADAAALQAAVGSMVAQLIKAGADGSIPLEDVASNLKELATQTDTSKTSLSDLDNAAKNSGNSATALANAYAGDTKGLKELDDEAKKKLKTDQTELTLEGQSAHQISLHTAALEDKTAAQQKDTDYLNQAVAVQKKADETTKQYDADTKALASTQAGQAAAATKEYTDAGNLYSDIGSKIEAQQEANDAAAKASSDKTKTHILANDAETAQAFLDELNQEYQDLQSSIAVKLQLYQEYGPKVAKAIIKDVGNDPAALDAIANATPAQMAGIIEKYGQGGKDSAINFGKEYNAAEKANQMVGHVVIKADASDIPKQVKAATSSPIYQKVIIDAFTRSGVRIN